MYNMSFCNDGLSATSGSAAHVGACRTSRYALMGCAERAVLHMGGVLNASFCTVVVWQGEDGWVRYCLCTTHH
jgi:hypothetical protein